MPQPNRLQFFLNDIELKNSPDGWDRYGAVWKRSEQFFGIDRTATVPLSFVRDGADILREEFFTHGYEGVAVLKIYENNPSTWQYELNFEGEINFATFKDDGDRVMANVVEGGLNKYLIANKDNVYEIPIADGYDVEVPRGVAFREDVTGLIVPRETGFAFSYLPLWINFINKSKGGNIVFNDIYSPFPNSTINKFDEEETEIHLRLAFRDLIVADFSDSGFYFVYITKDNSDPNSLGDITHVLFRQNIPLSQAGISVDIMIDTNIMLTDSGNYWIRHGFFSYSQNDYIYNVKFITETLLTDGTPDIQLQYIGFTKKFNIKCIPVSTLFEQLVSKMTDGRYTASSGLLSNGEGKYLFSTSGDGIRELSDAAIKISFSDFFQSINTVLNVGLGIEKNVAILEKKEYFFDKNTMIADLGEVSSMTLSIDNDMLFNKLNVGYKSQEYGIQLGRDEFNITLNFEAPITRSNSTMALISPMRADSYGIFYTQLKYVQEADDTTDGTADNDTFLIHVLEHNGGYMVDQSIEIIDGSINPLGVFNVFLSPKRCLLRHQNMISASLWKVDGLLRFISSERQDSNLNAGEIIEKEDINISDLTDTLYTPMLARILVNVPKNITDLMNNNNKGYYIFSFRGRQYKGFVVNINNALALNEPQEWTLKLIDN